MSVQWTIKRQNGTTKTLKDWGFKGVTLTRRSMAIDTLQFTCLTEGIDDTSNRLTEGETIRLLWQALDAKGKLIGDVNQYFVGRVQDTSPFCNASEGVSYTVVGPWWYLENLPYQQTWKAYVGGVLTEILKSRVRLCEDIDLNKLTIGKQITLVLQWVKDAGAPFDFNTTEIETDFQYFTLIDEVCDLMSTECIKRLLRFVPDAVGWFDYSSDTPTFKLKRYEQLDIVTLPIDENADIIVENCQLTPLASAQTPAVVLKYERTDQIGSAINSTITQTTYPDDGLDINNDAAAYAAKVSANERLFGVMLSTVNLEGSFSSYTAQAIECELITTAKINTLSYWQARQAWLMDPNLRDITFRSGTFARTESDPSISVYPVMSYELLRGAIHPWMTVGGAQVYGADFMASAIIKYRLIASVVNGVTKYTDYEEKTIYWPYTGTNAPTGTYGQQQLESVGEATPVALAKVIYDALNILYYSGSVQIDEEDCTGTYHIGQKINVTGGDTGWATAKAAIQSMTESLDGGKTTLQCGPPQHISVRDIIDWMRIFRIRKIRTSGTQRSTGQTPLGGKIDLGKHGSLKNPALSAGTYRSLVICPGPTSSKIIELNPDLMDANATMKPQKITFYLRNTAGICEQYTAWMMSSDPIKV